MSQEKELITPFTVDHDYVMAQQQKAMIPEDTEEKKESVADQLDVSDNKEKDPRKKTDKEIKEETNKLKDGIKKGLKKMIEILPEGAKDPNRKLYLVLLYINSGADNEEDTKDFFFIEGRQAVYDAIKDRLEAGEDIDCMRSLIFVDSNLVTIAAKTSIYAFMKDTRERRAVLDDTSFDINDYWYDISDMENIERDEVNGQE